MLLQASITPSALDKIVTDTDTEEESEEEASEDNEEPEKKEETRNCHANCGKNAQEGIALIPYNLIFQIYLVRVVVSM